MGRNFYFFVFLLFFEIDILVYLGMIAGNSTLLVRQIRM